MIDEWENFKKTVKPINKKNVTLKSNVDLYEKVNSKKKYLKVSLFLMTKVKTLLVRLL